MAPIAANDFVFILRDETQSETGGLYIPDDGKVKPHQGTIITAGPLVEDKNIKNGKGKKVLFHQHVGFEIPYEDKTYLVLTGREIIGFA